MVDFRAELAALVAAYDEHGAQWSESDVDDLWHAAERARAVLDRGDAAGSPAGAAATAAVAAAIAAGQPVTLPSGAVIANPAWFESRIAIRAVLAQPETAPAADGEAIEGQLISGWLPIDTAPRDGAEILASDYDALEIVHWYKEREGACVPGEWLNRQGRIMFPSWWQPLPEHPSLPEVRRG